ncbi:MAG: hypothetical protein JWP12_2042 [Bacteroidetes bacterium]|nr:hypothetical protein [Bacteroidota bacterium]
MKEIIHTMFYKASLDKMTKGISIFISVFFLFIIVFTSVLFSSEKDPVHTHSSFTTILLGFSLTASFIISWLFHPVGYEVTQGAIVIKRPANKVTINKQGIESVRLLEKSETAGTIRSFASGGLFGYFGKFNGPLGKMTWYVTNKNNMVLLKMRDGKIYVVSPDDTSTFIKEFGKQGN